MAYSLFVARKYIGAGRRSGFITAITIISVGGVAIGVLSLIVVLAVMNGFEREVFKRIIGTNAHVIVRKEGGIEESEEVMSKIRSIPHVVAVSPFVLSKAMIMTRNDAEAVFIKGIDLKYETHVTDFSQYVRPSGFTFSGEETRCPEIVIGKEVAFDLGVGLGDTIVAARADFSKDSLLGIVPYMKRFVVSGFFDSGMYEYDASLAFLSLREAQKFYSLQDRVTGLSVRIDDMDLAPQVGEAISLVLGGGFVVSDWIRMNRNLFTWMRTEKKVMFIILTLIIIVAAFNIASTLIMIVMERTKDIGILKSMGATSGAVMRIFMLHGVIVGAVGTAIGTVGGIVLSLIIDRYRLIQLPGDVYFIQTVPVQLRVSDVVAVACVAIVVSFLATILPSWRASKLVPVEAIRYE